LTFAQSAAYGGNHATGSGHLCTVLIHLDDGLADKCSTKELPEGHLSLTAANAAQIESSIRPS
jgi:hypothetical protein